METSELQGQSRAFRNQMLILRRELEEFGKQIKLEVDRSEQTLVRHLALTTTEEEGSGGGNAT